MLSGAGLIHGAPITKYNSSASSQANQSAATMANASTSGSLAYVMSHWDVTGLKTDDTGASDYALNTTTLGTLIGQMVTELDEVGEETEKTFNNTVYIQQNGEYVANTLQYAIKIVYADEVSSTSVYSWMASRKIISGQAQEVHVHKSVAQVVTNGVLDLSGALTDKDIICKTAPIFVMETEADGSLNGNVVTINDVSAQVSGQQISGLSSYEGDTLFVDFYVIRSSEDVYELQINAEDFAGAYYVEAETLFRRQDTQADLPAIFTLPNVKIQSNWTFSMSADGDPSTFTFTMDASPDYTYFDKTKKMLAVIQVIDDNEAANKTYYSVMGHTSSL